MTISPRFGCIPVASELHDRISLDRLIGGYSFALEKLGGTILREDEILRPMPPLYFVVTGGTERRILDLWERRRESYPDEPVYLLAHSDHNSLAASMEAMARIRQEGGIGSIISMRNPDDDAGISEINRAMHALEVRGALASSRILSVGEPSDWLVASSPSAEVIREQWGPELITVGIDELLDLVETADADEVRRNARQLRDQAEAVREPGDADLEESVRLHHALRTLCAGHHAQAVTLRCFDLVLDRKTTGCYAVARLNDEGIVAACEGDRVSALTMLWLHRLLGALPWMANPSRIERESNRIVLAHCTIPIGMTRGYILRSHFESGIGVGIQGHVPNGPVTLVRIGGTNLERIWCGEGEVIREHESETLCRTQAEITLTSGHVEELLADPLGNHLVMVPGHRRREILASREIILRTR